MRIRYGLVAFDDDSVPNTHLNVPLDPDITVPDAQPGAAFLGTPDPLYAVNIFAHPFVLLSPVVHPELSGILTQQPPYEPVTVILNSEMFAC